MPGPGRGERRGRGRNIAGMWDFMGSITPMLNSMFNRWDSMARIAERSARVRPSMEQHAFQQKQKEWEQQNKLFREGENQRKIERDRQARADAAAAYDRRAALSRMNAIDPAAAQGVTAGGYGGESPHQSEAQLQGWGVGAGSDLTMTPKETILAPPPIAPGIGAPGAGGPLIGDINVSATGGGSMASPPPAAAYGAMMGGGAQYSPFNTGFNTEFQSADIDKEKRKDED
jgi:hypothetical protein